MSHPPTNDSSTRPAERELSVRAHVDAPPDRVWQLLTDLRLMPTWSPELVRMVPLKPGGLRPGQWYLGINRRGGVVWPTRSVVSRLEPGRVLAWDTVSSGARWIWELGPAADGRGTEVVHRRTVPRGLSPVSRVFAPIFLGGSDGHADELEAGMARTVAALRAAAEA